MGSTVEKPSVFILSGSATRPLYCPAVKDIRNLLQGTHFIDKCTPLGRWEKDQFCWDNITIRDQIPDISLWEGPNTPIPWRPLLIPLDKDGQPDPTAGQDNPDGAVVTGGSLYFGANPVSIPDIHIGQVLPESGQFQIWNTAESPLAWVWINGCLLSLRVLGRSSIRVLAKNGWLASLNESFSMKEVSS